MFGRVDSTDEMISFAENTLLEEGILTRGDAFVMAAGIPPNQAAATNLMKLHSIGATTSGIPGGNGNGNGNENGPSPDSSGA